MPVVPGLRSPYARVGNLVHFGRMLDKIRLHAVGRLPDAYVGNLGGPRPTFFDGRCCRFLHIDYGALRDRTLTGATDREVLDWALCAGRTPSPEEIEIWNAFLQKIGWRDDRATILRQRISDAGLAPENISTMFDFIDFDEGRDPFTQRFWDLPPTRVVLLMGVAGSGKTTIGRALAESLGWTFYDADDFHPAANVAKMAAGHPLDDADRAPWLAALRARIDSCVAEARPAVVGCSALKADYREQLAPDHAVVPIVHLHGSPELLAARLGQRAGHFMKPAMLASQLATLEPPDRALLADIALPPADLVAFIRQQLIL